MRWFRMQMKPHVDILAKLSIKYSYHVYQSEKTDFVAALG